MRAVSSKKPLKNHCFACGKDNPQGMHLRFVHDKKRESFTCRFRLSKRYTGPPGYCHGGIIATILDDAMGKLNKLRQVSAVTAQMTVDYLKPVPLNQPLYVESRELRVNGRRHFHIAEIVNRKGEVLARSRGVFVAIDPERLFGRPGQKRSETGSTIPVSSPLKAGKKKSSKKKPGEKKSSKD